MSFCRFGQESDIYCYHHFAGFFQVHVGFNHGADLDRQFDSAEDTIQYLRELQQLEIVVPEYAIERLETYVADDFECR